MWRSATLLWAEPAVENPPALNKPDRVVAVALMVSVSIEALFRSDLVWRPISFCVGCGLVAAFLARRSRGLLSVGFGFATFAVLNVATVIADREPIDLYTGFVVVALVYSLFRWASGRDAAIGLAIMLTSFVVIVVFDFSGVADTVGGAAVMLSAAAIGASVRYRASVRRHLVGQAKFQERELLARELHDTVAHHVSAIAIQAQAGLFLARSSSRKGRADGDREALAGATEALVIIEREAAQTLAEMRTMVGALRDRQTQPDVAPQRSIKDIQSLAANGADSMLIDVQLQGELTNLPPALEAALFRVAQESITNAKRHARLATRVEVNVVGTLSSVQLFVSDDGAQSGGNSNPPGFGLIGMTERVTLLGGTLTAGPQADRGWRVHCSIPARFPVGGTA
jgi:signal transduction histidine kinase